MTLNIITSILMYPCESLIEILIPFYANQVYGKNCFMTNT